MSSWPSAALPPGFAKLSCKYVHSLMSSPRLAPDLSYSSPFSAENQPLGSLACYYSVLNGPDLCNIFYLATGLSLNSLFWMNTDFVTWSPPYNEMQTMERLNQFTKKSICQTVWRCSQFSPAAHAVLDKGAKHLAVHQMKIKASVPGIYSPFKCLCCNL